MACLNAENATCFVSNMDIKRFVINNILSKRLLFQALTSEGPVKKRRRWTKKTDVKDAKEPRKHLNKSKSPLTGKKINKKLDYSIFV